MRHATSDPNPSEPTASTRHVNGQRDAETAQDEPDRLTAGGRKVTRFAVVVPALNEEGAIRQTLERTLAARQQVVANTPIDEMLVVFVNDGSTDRTQEIADEFPEVEKIRFEKNRGYGAAIKAGFLCTDAELVGFMDADGTCDPAFFIQLINRLYETQADITLGARLNPESRMPLVRRVGNWIFARLISTVSGQSLTDSASGMRVIRRSSLRRLVPLPDGLHFTPVMSCMATLDPQMRIEEVPMPYEERVGRSKLSVVKDGFKFLATILFAASCYNPVKILIALSLLFCILGAGLSYVAWRGGAPAEAVTIFLSAFGFVFMQGVFVSVLCHELNRTLIGPRRIPGRMERIWEAIFQPKPLIMAGGLLFLIGLAFATFGLVVSATPGAVFWPAAALCIACAGWLALEGVVLRVIWAVHAKAKAAWEDPFPRQSESP